jgi:hypothetical protein
MAKKIKRFNLYLEAGYGTDRYQIVDDDKLVYTIDQARAAWDNGLIDDYNQSLGRLQRLNWDVEALKKYYAEADAARGKSSV